MFAIGVVVVAGGGRPHLPSFVLGEVHPQCEELLEVDHAVGVRHARRVLEELRNLQVAASRSKLAQKRPRFEVRCRPG